MNTTLETTTSRKHFLDQPVAPFMPGFTVQHLFWVLIIILAVFSRLYEVDRRVMAHDEVNHVVPAYDLYVGRGYAHDPVTHGPLQFHLLAASYFLFGDNDLSARIPAALFSIAAAIFVLFAFPRYIGRTGAILAGLFYVISPYLLYYGRYTRNEAFAQLFGAMMIYAVLRYLDKKDKVSLLLVTITTALNYIDKGTSYIFSAQLLIFLALLLFFRLWKSSAWKSPQARRNFLIFTLIGIILFMVLFFSAVRHASKVEVDETGTEVALVEAYRRYQIMMAIFGTAFVVAAVGDLVYLVSNLGWKNVRREPSFDLLVLSGVLILPLLAALPVNIIGWNPLDYTSEGLARSSIWIALLSAIAIAIGYWWKKKAFFTHMIIFYSIFIVFYTTFFTNGRGFFTGTMGTLGYWLIQQSVERGSQPLFYYVLIQMPMYEYLSIAGLAIAVFFGIRHKKFSEILPQSIEQPATESNSEANHQLPSAASLATAASVDKLFEAQLQTVDRPENEPEVEKKNEPVPVLTFLVFYSLISLLMFSIAGERMPWLTSHIAVPFSLTSAWGVAFLLERVDWKRLFEDKKGLGLLLIPMVVITFLAAMGALLGNQPPFMGKELDQLQNTYRFLFAALLFIASFYFAVRTFREYEFKLTIKLLGIAFMLLLAILTARTAYMASFPNAEYPTELLVYAHASPAPKEILAQIESISYRLTGGKDLAISYDNDSLYPFWWYLRDYSNARYFGTEPTREIADSVVILASTPKADKIDSIIRDNFVKFEYHRLWWPNQDYMSLTFNRIFEIIRDPGMRTAIFNIWLNRDYTLYGQIKNTDAVNIETWSPSDRFIFYIRKDVVSQIWQYGAAPDFEFTQEEDIYQQNVLSLTPDRVVGFQGSEAGNFNAPRGLAVAPDGSIYVADSLNHRIQRFSSEGEFLNAWGTFADVSNAPAPGGTFYEPWGVAVAQDGSVFVTDTWNHRIQKFTADGEFITSWGYFGTAETPEALWGPRGIAIDSNGLVYVTDTGNKRVVVYTPDGDFVGEFGGAGFDLGKFDEPVGIAVNAENTLYIADTWNRRVQALDYDPQTNALFPLSSWDVIGWLSQSLDNKPFIAVDLEGNVFITDPEAFRVIQFDASGGFIATWGFYSPGAEGFGLPSGIATDADGNVWVSDAGNHRLLRFTLP